MNFLLRSFFGWLDERPRSNAPPPEVVVSRQYVQQPLTSSRSGMRILVNRSRTPYWEERGWQKSGDSYVGSYQTPFGKWPGRVTESPSGRVEVFIQHPPKFLERHPHWLCFFKRDGGWFFVHPHTRVKDASAGILAVEKTLAEAYAT